MGKRLIAVKLVFLSVFLWVGCKGRSSFRPSIESAKPLEIWEKGKPFSTVIEKLLERNRNLQSPAFERWLDENINGHRLDLTLLQAQSLDLSECHGRNDSLCFAKFKLNIGADGWLNGPITLHLDEDKALALPKKGKLSIKGIIHKTIVVGESWYLHLWPADFEIIQ